LSIFREWSSMQPITDMPHEPFLIAI